MQLAKTQTELNTWARLDVTNQCGNTERPEAYLHSKPSSSPSRRTGDTEQIFRLIPCPNTAPRGSSQATLSFLCPVAPGPAVFQSRDTTRTKVGQRLSAGGLLGRSSDGERGDRGEDEKREYGCCGVAVFSFNLISPLCVLAT